MKPTAPEPEGRVAERKPRSIETIITRSEAILSRLITALELLHNMEERLIGRSDETETAGDNPVSASHVSTLNQQQERIEALCVEIINSINRLEDHI